MMKIALQGAILTGYYTVSMNSLEELFEVCNEITGLDLANKCRDRDTYAYGRASFYLIAKILHPRVTFERLGKFSNRDHSTVLMALRRARDTYVNDPVFLGTYNAILARLGIDPAKFDGEREEELNKLPRSLYKYVKEMETQVESYKKEVEEVKTRYSNTVLLDYCMQIPSEHVNEFIQYRVIPFLKMKLIHT